MGFPLILIPLWPIIQAWATRALLAGGLIYFTEKIAATDLEAEVKKWIVSAAAQEAGLQLDVDAPWSDASLSNALSIKIGFTVRTLKDKESLREDAEAFALDKIAERTGYRITTLRDVDRLKYDLLVIGLSIIQAKTGIPITPPEYGGDWADAVREAVLDWARAKVNIEMASQVSSAISEIEQYVDLEAVAGRLNFRLGEIGSVQQIDAKQLAMYVAEDVVKQSVARFQVTAKSGAKVSKRALQLRDAQRRFRERHGNRLHYQPIN